MAKAAVLDDTEAPRELPLPDMTFEEFLQHPDVPERAEWVDGRVFAMGTVSFEHARLTQFLATLLNMWVSARRLGVVLGEPFNLRLPSSNTGRAPDLMVVLEPNLQFIVGNHLEGPADIAVEVLSRSTASIDRGQKFFDYEAGGVRECWLIDPQRAAAEFYALDDRGRYQLTPTVDGVFRSAVLPGFFLRLAWLWDLPNVLDAADEIGVR